MHKTSVARGLAAKTEDLRMFFGNQKRCMTLSLGHFKKHEWMLLRTTILIVRGGYRIVLITLSRRHKNILCTKLNDYDIQIAP